MSSIRVVVLIVALLSASSAMGAEWWWISASGDKPNRQLGFIDKESSTTDYGGRISAWSFSIYETPQDDGIRKSKDLYRFDCKGRTMTLVHSVDYGNNDKLIRSTSWENYQQKNRPVIPDSIGEAKWQFVCKGISPGNEPLSMSPEEFSARYFRYIDY